jgi:hypothetical protein
MTLKSFVEDIQFGCIVLGVNAVAEKEDPTEIVNEYFDELIAAQTDPDRRALAGRVRDRIIEQGKVRPCPRRL